MGCYSLDNSAVGLVVVLVFLGYLSGFMSLSTPVVNWAPLASHSFNLVLSNWTVLVWGV